MSINYHRRVVLTGQKLRRFVAIAIALSFLTMLVPIAGAFANNSNMPCCAGKSGHCDSGLLAKKPPQPKEPMCGLHIEPEDDGNTIVAEALHTESHTTSNGPVAESASLSKPCRMDCGACTIGSTQQQKRERTIAAAGTRYASPLTVVSYHENLPSSFSSNDGWTQTIPRGPPIGR